MIRSSRSPKGIPRNAGRAARSPTGGSAPPVVAGTAPRPPSAHPSGAGPPRLPAEQLPRHVAIVMDGNGRWAKARGLPRTKGHERGEYSLFDTVEGAIEIGIPFLSAYAFSTENWKRSPDEVRFLMGFNRDVIRRRRDQLIELGVRVVWSGRPGRLWRSVIRELQTAEAMSAGNSTLTLQFCVNYGGRAEIADAAAALARDAAAGRLNPDRVTEETFARYLYHPEVPEVDLFLRPSGELRTSNYLIWQSAYAELVFLDTLWPDFDRRHLWYACELYAQRERRFGQAVPNPMAPPGPVGVPAWSTGAPSTGAPSTGAPATGATATGAPAGQDSSGSNVPV